MWMRLGSGHHSYSSVFISIAALSMKMFLATWYLIHPDFP